MKKVFIVLAFAGLLVACNNSTETKTEETKTKEVESTDTSKMMNDPSQNMAPPDTMDRRPRD